jgi:hypothetical protein
MLSIIPLPIRYAYSMFKNRSNLILFSKALIKAWVYVFLNIKQILRKRKTVQASKKVSNEEIKNWFKKYSINF